MTKIEDLSDEEILSYMKAGWRFYLKKTSSGSRQYAYITMRKGSKTTSLGPYTDMSWDRIQRLKQQFAKDPLEVQEKTSRYETRKRLRKARSDIISNLSIERGDIMSRTCSYVKNGFCQYWVWPKKMPFFTFFEDVYKEKIEYVKSRDESDTNWIVKAHSFYCANCIAYKRKPIRVPVRVIRTHE